jgi:hypothetical protein
MELFNLAVINLRPVATGRLEIMSSMEHAGRKGNFQKKIVGKFHSEETLKETARS